MHTYARFLTSDSSSQSDIILAGGAESAVTPLAFAGFAAMRAMATTFNDDPLRASRPFDKDRAGFVMGEGCGASFYL